MKLADFPVQPVPGVTSGVYFLLHDSTLVYVGQSINIANRVGQHRTSSQRTTRNRVRGHFWNRVVFLPVPEDKLDVVESAFIHYFRPPGNGNLSSREKAAPISLTNWHAGLFGDPESVIREYLTVLS